MELWEAKVSCYNKTQKGKKTLQCEIRLNKGHPFDKGEEVVIVKSNDLSELEEARVKDLNGLEEEVRTLNETTRLLNMELKETLKKLTVTTSIINQYKEVMKTQETLLAIYTNMGLMDRLRNKKPNELTHLTEEVDKLKRLENSTPLIIELTSPGGEEKGK